MGSRIPHRVASGAHKATLLISNLAMAAQAASKQPGYLSPLQVLEAISGDCSPLQVVAALTGEVLCEVAARPDMTLANLKMMIQLATGIEFFEQKLITSRGVALGDDAVILGPGIFVSARPTLTLMKLDPVAAAAEQCRQLVLGQVKEGKPLKDLDFQYRGDREIVLAATKFNVCHLQHALPEVWHDGDLMLSAYVVNPIARCYMAPELWLNREFVYQAVLMNGLLLEYAPTFSNDLDVVLAAASNNGYALRYAGLQACADKTIVLAAVRQKGTAMSHASEALKHDREVVLAAVENEKMAVVHAKGGLRKDPQVQDLVAAARRAEAMKFSCCANTAEVMAEELAMDHELISVFAN